MAKHRAVRQACPQAAAWSAWTGVNTHRKHTGQLKTRAGADGVAYGPLTVIVQGGILSAVPQDARCMRHIHSYRLAWWVTPLIAWWA